MDEQQVIATIARLQQMAAAPVPTDDEELFAQRDKFNDAVEALQTMVECAESPDFDGVPSNAVLQQARTALANLGL